MARRKNTADKLVECSTKAPEQISDRDLESLYNKSRNSSYWLPKEKNFENKDAVYISLLQASSKFVNILLEKNFPVTFSTSAQSGFTNGELITISSNIKNIDTTVGLALHEASHIKYSENLLKSVQLFNYSFDYRNHGYRLIQDSLPALYNQKFIKLFNHIGSLNLPVKLTRRIHSLVNFLEDRRIDMRIQKEFPGYVGYYESLENTFFSEEDILSLISKPEIFTPSLNSYITNLYLIHTTYFDATRLPGLDRMAKLININTIADRSESDILNLGMELFILIINEVLSAQKNQPSTTSKSKEKSEESKKSDSKEKSESKETSEEPADEENDEETESEESNESEEPKEEKSKKTSKEKSDKDEKSEETSENESEEPADENSNSSASEDEESDSDLESTNESEESNESGELSDEELEELANDTKDLVDETPEASEDNSTNPIEDASLTNDKQIKDIEDNLNHKTEKKNTTEAQNEFYTGVVNGCKTHSIKLKNNDEFVVYQTSLDKMNSMNETLFKSGYNVSASRWSCEYNSKAIAEGIKLGKMLQNKIALKNDAQVINFFRQATGKIDGRLISEYCISGNTEIFKNKTEIALPSMRFHISTDFSGSMSQLDIYNTIKLLTTLIVATENFPHIRLTADARTTLATAGYQPMLIDIFDSSKHGLNHVKKHFPKLIAGGSATQESLFYEVIRKDLASDPSKFKYFITLTDGGAGFKSNVIKNNSNGLFSADQNDTTNLFQVTYEMAHCKYIINDMKRKSGIETMCYFLTSDENIETKLPMYKNIPEKVDSFRTYAEEVTNTSGQYLNELYSDFIEIMSKKFNFRSTDFFYYKMLRFQYGKNISLLNGANLRTIDKDIKNLILNTAKA